MQPDIVYCPQCEVIHPINRHLRQDGSLEPEPQQAVQFPSVAPQIAPRRPLSAVELSPQNETETAPPSIQEPLPAKPTKFDKNKYMAPYMRDRREADKAGFHQEGPNYLTVKQYRLRKASDAALQIMQETKPETTSELAGYVNV